MRALLLLLLGTSPLQAGTICLEGQGFTYMDGADQVSYIQNGEFSALVTTPIINSPCRIVNGEIFPGDEAVCEILKVELIENCETPEITTGDCSLTVRGGDNVTISITGSCNN